MIIKNKAGYFVKGILKVIASSSHLVHLFLYFPQTMKFNHEMIYFVNF